MWLANHMTMWKTDYLEGRIRRFTPAIGCTVPHASNHVDTPKQMHVFQCFPTDRGGTLQNGRALTMLLAEDQAKETNLS